MKFDMRVYLKNNKVPEEYANWFYEFLKDIEVKPSDFDIEDNSSLLVGNPRNNNGTFLLFSKDYDQPYSNFTIGQYLQPTFITFSGNKIEIDVRSEDDEYFIKTFEYNRGELIERDMYFDSDAEAELYNEHDRNENRYMWSGAKDIFDFLGISPDFEEEKDISDRVNDEYSRYIIEEDPYIMETCKNIFFNPESYIEEVNSKRNKLTL